MSSDEVVVSYLLQNAERDDLVYASGFTDCGALRLSAPRACSSSGAKKKSR